MALAGIAGSNPARGQGCLCVCVCVAQCRQKAQPAQSEHSSSTDEEQRGGKKKKNPVGGMYVCLLWVLCVLSGRGLGDGLITRLEESYPRCRVIVCDLETSRMRRLKPASGLWKPVEEEVQVLSIKFMIIFQFWMCRNSFP
jgi:hypothetical protein